MKAIRTKIIKIGNSQGLRIPKFILDQLDLGAEVELEVQGDCLLIRPGRKPREGWEEVFQRMAANHDDQLLDAESMTSSSWDEEAWEW